MEPLNLDDSQRFELVRLYSSIGLEAAKDYDTRLFWLSGGAITLSAAGAQALRKTQSLAASCAFVFGVVLLLAAMAVVMVSFRMTAAAAGQWIRWHQNGDETALASARRIMTRTEVLSIVSLSLVVLGLLSLVVFYVWNLF